MEQNSNSTPQPPPSDAPIRDSLPSQTLIAPDQISPNSNAATAPQTPSTSPNPAQAQSSAATNQHLHNKASLRRIVGIISFIGAIFLAAFIINQFIFQSYFVDGTSMTPTLQNNDRLIISKVEKTFAALQGKPYIPNRGQIVILDSSIIGINGQSEQLIKRVIGLPGDTIHIADGVVTIKNTEFPDGFNVDTAIGLKLEPTYSDSPIDFTVGPQQVFVMGDNRIQNGSYDSRIFGPVDSSKLAGRLWQRILPLDKIKLFSSAINIVF